MLDTIVGINKEVSLELGFDEDLVKKVNKFFWEKGVKNSIRTGDYTNIRIRGLGTIATSKFKLYRDIKWEIGIIRNMRKMTKDFKKKTKEEVIEEHMIQLRKLLIRRNELAEAFYPKQIRYNERTSFTDMEEQEDNS